MQSHRLSWVIGIVLVGSLGAIYAIASTILINSFVLVEQRQAKADLAQAADAVNNELNVLAIRF